MPTTVDILTIFVSGPSDVDSEKAALRRVVTDLSDRLMRTHKVTLRVVGWPEDIRPGVNIDAQAEIQRQLGADFDIYLGILGTRFGTPTHNAGSGTEEEFEQGVTQLRRDSRSLRVLFYFKTGAVDPFHDLEIEQLQKVKKFRASLRSRGVVYRDFGDTTEFVTMVQQHLERLINDEWKDRQWTPIPGVDEKGSQEASSTGQDAQLEDDMDASDADADADSADGILDYMAAFHEETSAVSGTLRRLVEGTERIGEEIKTRAAELNGLHKQHEKVRHLGGSREQQEFVANARATVNQAAQNLDDFVHGMAPNVNEYRKRNRTMFANLRNGLQAGAELGNPADEEGAVALEGLISGLEAARNGTAGFQASIDGMPVLTGRFKRAKRRAAAMLGELIAEIALTTDEAREVLKEMREGGRPRVDPGRLRRYKRPLRRKSPATGDR